MCNYDCDLHKLAKILNGAQKSYEFVVPLPKPNTKISITHRLGIHLTRRKPLSNDKIREAAPKTLGERRIAVSTYITSFDAAEQCLTYADHVVGQGTAKPLSDEDIIVVIGGEVVVPDTSDNEFEGDAEFDAYSCISVIQYDIDGTITKTSEGIEILDYNEALTPVQNVSFVSLRRLPKIFPEINFTDIAERARCIVSRYLISNIVGFVGNRTFGVALAHDDMFGCLNETNWVGGERASYYIDEYCQRCVSGYVHHHVLDKYNSHPSPELFASLYALCRVSGTLDRIVKSNERAALWINIGLVAISLNILDAFIFDMALAGYDKDLVPAWLHFALTIKPHVPAVAFGLGVFLIGASYLLRYARSRARLP